MTYVLPLGGAQLCKWFYNSGSANVMVRGYGLGGCMSCMCCVDLWATSAVRYGSLLWVWPWAVRHAMGKLQRLIFFYHSTKPKGELHNLILITLLCDLIHIDITKCQTNISNRFVFINISIHTIIK